MPKQGMLLIISGPSGAGKTTIARRVEEVLGARFSVSVTTRPMGPNDLDGVDYHFIDKAEFERLRDGCELLEWAPVFDNYYGTPRQPVADAIEHGDLMILEIDIAGAEQVKAKLPDAFGVFVLPPSEAALLDRLRSRAREGEDVIQKRFARAKDEIARSYTCGAYDVHIVNDDLEAAVDEAVRMVSKELERRRQG